MYSGREWQSHILTAMQRGCCAAPCQQPSPLLICHILVTAPCAAAFPNLGQIRGVSSWIGSVELVLEMSPHHYIITCEEKAGKRERVGCYPPTVSYVHFFVINVRSYSILTFGKVAVGERTKSMDFITGSVYSVFNQNKFHLRLARRVFLHPWKPVPSILFS